MLARRFGSWGQRTVTLPGTDKESEGAPVTSRSRRRYYCRCGTRLAKDNTDRQCAQCQRISRDKLIAPPEVPAEFWKTEQFEEAFAAQHIGWVSRAYRTHPHHYAIYGPDGISQTLLGQWLGLRQPQISRIETGPPIRSLDTLVYWARVLTTNGKNIRWAGGNGAGRGTVSREFSSALTGRIASSGHRVNATARAWPGMSNHRRLGSIARNDDNARMTDGAGQCGQRPVMADVPGVAEVVVDCRWIAADHRRHS